MKPMTWLFAASLLLVAVAPLPAAAYVGPGAGLGLLAALWGLLVAVAMAFGFVLLWPLRRYLLGRRRVRAPAERPEPMTVPRSGPS